MEPKKIIKINEKINLKLTLLSLDNFGPEFLGVNSLTSTTLRFILFVEGFELLPISVWETWGFVGAE